MNALMVRMIVLPRMHIVQITKDHSSVAVRLGTGDFGDTDMTAEVSNFISMVFWIVDKHQMLLSYPNKNILGTEMFILSKTMIRQRCHLNRQKLLRPIIMIENLNFL